MKKKVVAPLSRHCGKARVAQNGRFFLLGVGTERCYARKRETDGFGFGVGHSHRPATVKTSFLSPLPSLSVFEGQGEKEANMLAHFFRQNSKRTVNKFEEKCSQLMVRQTQKLGKTCRDDFHMRQQLLRFRKSIVAKLMRKFKCFKESWRSFVEARK